MCCRIRSCDRPINPWGMMHDSCSVGEEAALDIWMRNLLGRWCDNKKRGEEEEGKWGWDPGGDCDENNTVAGDALFIYQIMSPSRKCCRRMASRTPTRRSSMEWMSIAEVSYHMNMRGWGEKRL